jgi:DnaJ-class molecular chaperone
MDDRDYYVILGISRSESLRGVRSAFRDLARQHHPDHAGPAGAPHFRDVVEAYRVLSDPERRREYDASLGREVSILTRRQRRATATPRAGFDPIDLFGRPDSIRPSAEALHDRFMRNFMEWELPKGEHLEPLLCDVALTPAEAGRGGVLPLRIPVLAPCTTCRGTGHIAGFPCLVCGANGRTTSEVVVELEVPPGIRSGTIVEASLEPWGIHNLWLRVRIGVLR